MSMPMATCYVTVLRRQQHLHYGFTKLNLQKKTAVEEGSEQKLKQLAKTLFWDGSSVFRTVCVTLHFAAARADDQTGFV